MRELNKPTQSPINFASTTNYHGEFRAEVPICRTYFVKDCMRHSNDLAQKLRQLPIEHSVEEATLNVQCDVNTAPSSVAASIVKPKGATGEGDAAHVDHSPCAPHTDQRDQKKQRSTFGWRGRANGWIA
jgi:hypothetical protein